MPRNVFHRDFTLLKAALLAGLMGVAMLLGKPPLHQDDETASTPHKSDILPANLEGDSSDQPVSVSL